MVENVSRTKLIAERAAFYERSSLINMGIGCLQVKLRFATQSIGNDGVPWNHAFLARSFYASWHRRGEGNPRENGSNCPGSWAVPKRLWPPSRQPRGYYACFVDAHELVIVTGAKQYSSAANALSSSIAVHSLSSVRSITDVVRHNLTHLIFVISRRDSLSVAARKKEPLLAPRPQSLILQTLFDSVPSPANNAARLPAS